MNQPDVIVIMTDEERAIPSYEDPELLSWREQNLSGRQWFFENGVSFDLHYTGSLACVPSRPTLFTGQYPDLHGVTQTDGLGKDSNDSRMRWLPTGEVPTIGHWFRAAGYDTHYDGKWHISHADLIDKKTGLPLATNTETGEIIDEAVQLYLEKDPLYDFGFSGWIGPEPHGALLANSGFIRDNLIANRVVDWLDNRYKQRKSGDPKALKPFLLVASFVNPHDIVLFPAWRRQENNPIKPSRLDPPLVPEPPTRYENLASKPAAQIAYKHAYFSGYGPSRKVRNIYENNEQDYRNLYYRLHLEVDEPINRVRKKITESGSDEAIIFRTSDHGELLGAHGGLHQKWFNLYDEATRVPFFVVRTGKNPTVPHTISKIPTSHVDFLPTALSLAGINQIELAHKISTSFSEFHPLPGKDLSSLLSGQNNNYLSDRAIYMATRDNMLEGDTLASGLARRLGKTNNPPKPMRIRVPSNVASNFEGIVVKVDETDARGGGGHLWKLVRAFDDPATWSNPHYEQLASSGATGNKYRNIPIPDQWELYNLTEDPIELFNKNNSLKYSRVFLYMKKRLNDEFIACVPSRNKPWNYAKRKPPIEQIPFKNPSFPARFLRHALNKAGMHPEDLNSFQGNLISSKALIVCTNRSWLDSGKPTGLFASEMTVPYYLFSKAGIEVDLASPIGGAIPVDPLSLKSVIRSHYDDRFLLDNILKTKVKQSIPMVDIKIDDYEIIFFAGGWGAAFDLGFSEIIGQKVTEANNKGKILGGVCHGLLGFIQALGTDGCPLIQGRRVTGVTDKQIEELGIENTPHHPETELRKLGANFQAKHRFRDSLANHWEVDGNLVTGQNQNAGPMVAREIMSLLANKKQNF